MSIILPIAVGLLPLVILLATAIRQRKIRRERFKTPLTSKLLRPPGEFLRQEIARFEEKINEQLITFLGVCAVIGVCTWLRFKNGEPVDALNMGVFLFLPYGICSYLGVRLFRTMNLRNDYDLGFLGERAVGEELNQMMMKGYAVFHDIQFEGAPGSKNFNIDHVAVGPGGVFAVETKTRRKRTKKEQKGTPNIVSYDGAKLTFPWGSDDFGISQARKNAGILAAWLEKAAGAKIDVKPILALPGWMVQRKGRGDVTVVSGREICSVFPNEAAKEVLTAPQIKLIRFHLDERCRNVEVE